MILVYTNVVAEPLKERAEPRVIAWLDRQELETLFLSTITVAEILLGVARLPAGKRRERLAGAVERDIGRLFAGRILAFDLAAAQAYASLVSIARSRGFSVAIADGQIAAIAEASRLAVATRDEAPFRAMGLNTINPWTE